MLQDTDIGLAAAHLLERRRANMGGHVIGNEWIATDPVVGFLAPILWKTAQRPGGAELHVAGAQDYWSNFAQFMLVREGLKEILIQTRSAGIPVIVLKGAVLARTLYASPGFRAMGDLDLLVQRRDFAQVLQRLAAIGWQPRLDRDDRGLFDLASRTDADEAWQPGEWTLHNQSGHALDLHWHLVPVVWLRAAYLVDMEAIWRQSIPFQTAELVGGSTLSAVHTLLYLCLHIAQHGLTSLRQLLDVDLFVRQAERFPGWSWGAFRECAVRWRMRSAAYHVLQFSQWLYGSPVQETILHDLNPGPVAKMRLSALIRPDHLVQHPPAALGRRYPALVKTALIDRSVDIIKMGTRILAPSSQWRRYRYENRVTLLGHWKHAWQVMARGD